MKPVSKALGSVGSFVVLSVVGLASQLGQAAVVSPIVSPVYGNDDRQDLYQVTDPMMLRLADSTVALIQSDSLSLNGAGTAYTEYGSSLTDRHNVCSSEPFASQKALAFCSGALVGPDLVMTAGHCITDQSDCDTAKIAFGFSLKTRTAVTESLPASEVYQCSEIVGRARDEGGADFAVIRLDRAVKGHAPLAIARTTSLTVGTPLAVIGHPDGLPAKVAGGAFVRNNDDTYKFLANLDTYHGNSGSPVFNTRTGLIEGILVEGEADYDYVDASQCYVNKKCADDGCRGESSTRVSFAAPYIPALTPTHPVVVAPVVRPVVVDPIVQPSEPETMVIWRGWGPFRHRVVIVRPHP